MLAVRWILGGLLLWLGAVNALLAWTMETCTGGAADTLVTGPILTLPLYFFGWLAIAKRGSNPLALVLVTLFPIGITAAVSIWTSRLAAGESACRLITSLPFEMDGRESLFIALWAATCLVFWIGLIFAFKNADWRRETAVEPD